MNTHTLEFDSETQKNISRWLNGLFDEHTKNEVRTLINEKPQEAIDAFYSSLSFGTGGLRGIMGVGSNRMNIYTVGAATQGLADYIIRQKPVCDQHSVFIGYDSRHKSREFAEEAAKVLAANDIQVFLCHDLRPTPLVSFGCRLENCQAAIMITASHNPPEYNGYKVFWSDGGQILSPHDRGIIEAISNITDPAKVKKVKTLEHPLINYHDDVDIRYVEEGSKLQLDPQINQTRGKELNLVYTSLHGTGITLIPRMLAAWGFSSVTYEDQQIIPDGNFPTVESPNPEESEALTLGIKKLKESGADLLIATDPDADRVGVAVNHHGKIVLIDGNQLASICLEYICDTLTRQNKLSNKAAFIKTIGTTELFQAICNAYQRPCINVLTGFKYVAEKIREWENDPQAPVFIFGGEESYGYLLGSITRDKDGVIASCLIAEVALHAKVEGKTLVDLLHALYRKYGVFFEDLLSVAYEESKAGKEMMPARMARLRKNLPSRIHGIDVVSVEDYLNSIKTDLKTGLKSDILLPKSNVLLFWLADGSKIMVRPSGTEPKIKLYGGVVDKSTHDLEKSIKRAKQKVMDLLSAVKALLVP